MGQCKWAIGGALVLVIAAGRLYAQESSGESARAEAEQRIEAALHHKLLSPLDFVETPLNVIMDAISSEYGIPIVFDHTALEAVAQSPDVEITTSLGDITLRSALELMLRNVDDVTYIIDNEVLLITTEDEASTRLEARVYRIDNLRNTDPIDRAMSGRIGSGGARAPFNSLIDLVAATIESESWQENGTGEGEIQPFGESMLVITQTRRVHEKIEKLFADLRRTREAVLADAAQSDDTTLITRGVRVYDSSLARDPAVRSEIEDAIKKSVPWTPKEGEMPEDAFIKVLPTRVIVRHYPSVVRQVLETLRDLEVQTEPAPNFHSGSALNGGFDYVGPPATGNVHAQQSGETGDGR